MTNKDELIRSLMDGSYRPNPVFCVLNTLTNISFYNVYAIVCGLTKDEMFELVLPIMLKKIDCSYAVQYTEKGKFFFEEHIRFILKNLFYICGFNVKEEQQMANGRIDLVVETYNIIYIIERKMSDRTFLGLWFVF